MATKSKLVNGIDNDVWNDFVSDCRKKGVKVGECLTDLIKEYMKRQKWNNDMADKIQKQHIGKTTEIQGKRQRSPEAHIESDG